MRIGFIPAMTATVLCVGAGATLAQSAPSAKAQKAAILACKNSLGVGGGFQTTSAWDSNTPFGGATIVRIKPYGQVTHALADQINACAARSLGGSAPEAMQYVTDASTYVPAEPVFDKYAPDYAPAYQEPESYGCIMGHGVMQRGTLICPGH